MNSKRIILGSALLAVLLIGLFIKVPVTVVSFEDGRFFLQDDEFEIGWIHSVEKEPWFEKYIVKDEILYLVETRFKTFGAGTPSTGDIIPSNDGFIHMKLNYEMEEINLVVSRNVQTTLYTKKSTILLYELADNHTTFNIANKELPIWQIIRGEFK